MANGLSPAGPLDWSNLSMAAMRGVSMAALLLATIAAAPLAAGVLLGNPAAGTVATTGALNVSFSDGSDPYVRRAGRMFTAACIAAVAVFIGGVFGTEAPSCAPAAVRGASVAIVPCAEVYAEAVYVSVRPASFSCVMSVTSS